MFNELPSKACSTFKASLALVSKYGIPPFDWQKVMALFDDIILLFSSTSILFPSTTYSAALATTSIPPWAGNVRMGSFQGLEGLLVSGIRPSSCPEYRSFWNCSHRRPVHNSLRPDRRLRLETEIAPALQYPITNTPISSWKGDMHCKHGLPAWLPGDRPPRLLSLESLRLS